MEDLIQNADWDKIERILKRSEANQILPPERGFLGLRFRCPQCNHRVQTRYFKEVWRLLGRFAILYRLFQCKNCGWQYAAKVGP